MSAPTATEGPVVKYEEPVSPSVLRNFPTLTFATAWAVLTALRLCAAPLFCAHGMIPKVVTGSAADKDGDDSCPDED